MDRAAKAMIELLFANDSSRVLHLENPTRQPWADILGALSTSLSVSTLPYEKWLEKVKSTQGPETNPCAKIVPFLEGEFLRMAAGTVVLDTQEGRRLSETLRACDALDMRVVERYVDSWRQGGFLV